MAIFGFGKGKANHACEPEKPCACAGDATGTSACSRPGSAARPGEAGEAAIRILGSGCAKYRTLEANVLEALNELGIDERVDHVTDFAQIAAYGVMTTPTLVVDGRVAVSGRLPARDELLRILRTRKG